MNIPMQNASLAFNKNEKNVTIASIFANVSDSLDLQIFFGNEDWI